MTGTLSPGHLLVVPGDAAALARLVAAGVDALGRGRNPTDQEMRLLRAVTQAARNASRSVLGSACSDEGSTAAQSALTTAQAAKALDVSTSRIRRLCREGRLSAVQRGRSWFIVTDSLGEYVQQQRQGKS
ncbi:hypothetical protein Cme02nite_45100 [Catellatospora methionotrophica]|uniref:Helix-turn-helix domain-containing protein n=1 Tax=Catellatospora methionotrophica TaxID=121620 RepID=A0A8J3L863_9ACTN|nr:helix-turn-helix domain-containing protein [Catellatospora methionotrophica]GIG16178.1 hypothetical protein Cme02nite_45100 [Catellatospora methionotrophica]